MAEGLAPESGAQQTGEREPKPVEARWYQRSRREPIEREVPCRSTRARPNFRHGIVS